MMNWSTHRQAFEAFSTGARSETSSLVNAYLGYGSRMVMDAARPNKRTPYESLLFEFMGHSPSGWAEYIDPVDLRDCAMGGRTMLPRKTALKVHFDACHRDPGFIANSLSGRGIIRDAMLVCDEGGSVEWAIGLSDVREFTVDVSDLYGDQGCVVVAVQVKR